MSALANVKVKFQLNKANSSDTEATSLDLNLSIDNGIVSAKIYDKRDDFDFDTWGSYILTSKRNVSSKMLHNLVNFYKYHASAKHTLLLFFCLFHTL